MDVAADQLKRAVRCLLLSGLIFLWGIGFGLAQHSPLLRLCLTGSDNPAEIKKAHAACAAYLAGLMQDVRFGIVTPQLMATPFCLPKRDLTDEESGLIFKMFSADNPQVPPRNLAVVFAVMLTKANKCEPPK
jgi:hypothetical protein